MADRPDRTGVFQSGNPSGSNAEAERLKELVAPAVAANDLYLEDVEVRTAGTHRTVHVIVDLPEDQVGGVGLDTIAELSQVLSKILDSDPHDSGHPYDLEVSSPGVGRPLTEPRHWRRNLGRLVRAKVREGDDVTGRLLEVRDDGVTLRPQLAAKKGVKPKEGEPVELAFGNIRSGKVEIEFTQLDDELATAEQRGGLENEED
ncbi:putative Bcr YhbC family protein [Arthrobacter crystallopoietes BAB-32]|uniref:Ribosome maturation factor RimP n=1 Tax=Arthrobacter crystallopoietes BAB-32 TaxID=1246476 RepID=N1UXM1_9MICC|nr:putative Bcr YhbC family protein [Arthrobacter crystallopoietes BAB-32]